MKSHLEMRVRRLPAGRKWAATAIAAVLGCAALVLPAAAASPISVVPHRAEYALTLQRARPASSVVAAEGTMVVTWGESCAGWEVEQVIKLRMHSRQERVVNADTVFKSTESKDGTRYSFDTRTLYDGKPHEIFRGEAVMKADGSGGTAIYTAPEERHLTLEKGTLFPTAHTLHLIQKAIEGGRLDFSVVFDGATKEGSYRASTAVTDLKAADAAPVGVKEALANMPYWGMQVAFFPEGKDGTEPDWELTVAIQENGVARSLVLDYGDFAMGGKLTKIDKLPKPAC